MDVEDTYVKFIKLYQYIKFSETHLRSCMSMLFILLTLIFTVLDVDCCVKLLRISTF